MLLKVGHVFQAAPVITEIINDNRLLPSKGAYRVSRLYLKLKPEADLITARRDTMITAYQHKEMVPDPSAVQVEGGEPLMVEAANFSVPMDKMPEFTKAWAEVCAEEIEVAVEPIPLSQLSAGDDVPSAISSAEFIVLGGLVTDA